MAVGSTYNLNTKSGDLSDEISIDNNLVSRVPSNKCLGVLLDEKLTDLKLVLSIYVKRHVLA